MKDENSSSRAKTTKINSKYNSENKNEDSPVLKDKIEQEKFSKMRLKSQNKNKVNKQIPKPNLPTTTIKRGRRRPKKSQV